MSQEIKRVLQETLAELEVIPTNDLLDQRLQKFLDIGIFEESGKS
jgi:acetyl-CoA carboxylase alpha subunit